MSSIRSRPQVVPLLCLGGAVLFWGTSFVATKIALDSFPPMLVIWLRMAVACLAFALFWRRLPRPQYRRGDWKPLMLAVTCIPCLYYIFEGYAVRLTTSSQAQTSGSRQSAHSATCSDSEPGRRKVCLGGTARTRE